MEKNADFLLCSTDNAINTFFKELTGKNELCVRRFTQEEELFLTLERPFVVDSFAIHHDVQKKSPAPEYLALVRSLCRDWGDRLPELFHGLTWFFDPREIFKPLFLQILTYKERKYVYVLKVDLTFRDRHARVLDRGSNDRTPKYETDALFLESEVLPLESIQTNDTERSVYLAKTFQNTWKGESGRGYFVTGTWIDQEITKFLSRSVLPAGQKTFPFYPLKCRYNTISSTCVQLNFDGRKRSAAVLESVWSTFASKSSEIQNALHDESFHEKLPLFLSLRSSFPPEMSQKFGRYRLEPYLSENGQKEYVYHAELE